MIEDKARAAAKKFVDEMCLQNQGIVYRFPRMVYSPREFADNFAEVCLACLDAERGRWRCPLAEAAAELYCTTVDEMWLHVPQADLDHREEMAKKAAEKFVWSVCPATNKDTDYGHHECEACNARDTGRPRTDCNAVEGIAIWYGVTLDNLAAHMPKVLLEYRLETCWRMNE
jgi:hypothetical protein